MISCRQLRGADFVVQTAEKPISASAEFQIFSGVHGPGTPLAWQGPLGLADFLPGCHILMPSY